ncbi:MAG: carbohydrate kinase family protein, partial [Acidimicrobiia bacterium]
MITVVGEALIDLVIDPSGHVTAALGGAPFNTARACGRLGVDVRFVGMLSQDRFGTMLRAQLVADGVDVSDAPSAELPTTLAAAELDERGTASYRFYIDGTSAPALDVAPPVAPGDLLFTGGLGLVLAPMATTVEALVAGAGDATVVVDVNCRPLVIPDRERYVARLRRVLAAVDVVKVSDEDLAYLSPGLEPVAAARELLELGPRVVVLTGGGSGVHVVTSSAERFVPVEAVDVVDTIGAGDTFGGGLLAWLTLHGVDAAGLADPDVLERAVRAANTAAGVACTRRGADPPHRADLPP